MCGVNLMPNINLSPSRCIMCESKVEYPGHLFSFCLPLLVHILEASGWSLAFPNIIFNLLAYVLVGHPFHGPKKVLWLALNGAFFWNLRDKRNGRLTLQGCLSSFDHFMDIVLYVLSNPFLCLKNKHPFVEYSLSNLISH